MPNPPLPHNFTLHHAPTAESTMDAIKPFLRADFTNIPVYYVNQQTQGRGRNVGRKWQTEIGNVICTYAIPIHTVPSPVTGLPLVVSLALLDTLKSLGVKRDIQLKWPNDVLVDGMKVAGILIEKTDPYYLIGMGVNVTWHPQETHPNGGGDILYPTTKIGDDIMGDRMDIITGVVERTVHYLSLWDKHGFAHIINAWTNYAAFINCDVNIVDGDNRAVGTFVGLTDTGAIRVKIHGTEKIFYAGDVSLRSL